MTNPKSRRSKRIGNIDPNILTISAISWPGVPSKDDRDEFTIGDGLEFGTDDHAGELINLLIHRLWIQFGIAFRPVVMLSEEESVDGSQTSLFICLDITCEEEARTGCRGIVKAAFIVGEQITMITLSGLEFTTPVQSSQRKGAGIGGTVNLGSIDLSGNGVDLFPNPVVNLVE